MSEHASPGVVFAANRGFALSNSRVPLMERFMEAGWRVIIATADDEHARSLVARGVQLEPVTFARRGLSGADLKSLRALRGVFRKHRPRLIHHFHAKPMMLGSVAARLSLRRSVRVVNTVTGLGRAFVNSGLARQLGSAGYLVSGRLADATVFQNPDDAALFTDKGWVSAERARLIVSSGVDTERFRPAPNPTDGPLRVLMVARLLRSKGVAEFIDAARIVRARHQDVVFQLAGELESGSDDAFPEQDIERAHAEGVIDYIGYLSDIEKTLPECAVFVLPSYYREGVPRVVLEAAACGVPAIVADSPGTREAVVDGVTGYHVPPRDAATLAERIISLVESAEQRAAMGISARTRILESFDTQAITEQQIAVYRDLGCAPDSHKSVR